MEFGKQSRLALSGSDIVHHSKIILNLNLHCWLYLFSLYIFMQGKTAVWPARVGGTQEALSQNGEHTDWKSRTLRKRKCYSTELSLIQAMGVTFLVLNKLCLGSSILSTFSHSSVHGFWVFVICYTFWSLEYKKQLKEIVTLETIQYRGKKCKKSEIYYEKSGEITFYPYLVCQLWKQLLPVRNNHILTLEINNHL